MNNDKFKNALLSASDSVNYTEQLINDGMLRHNN